MAQYAYRARDKRGAQVKGQLEADSQPSAKKLISELGLIPIQVKTAVQFNPIREVRETIDAFVTRVPLEELLMFTQQLQTIYAVGIPVLEGLRLIQDQTEDENLKKTLLIVIEDIQEGASLHQALGRHPRIFDSVFCSLVQAGEMSGKLEELLGQLSVLLERRHEQKAKVKSATFYPKMVFGFIVVVFIVVITFVLPKLQKFFDKFGGDLPTITRFVMGISEFFQSFWYLVLFGVIGLVVAFKKWVATEKGGYLWDEIKMKIPVMGSLLVQVEMYGFCTIMEHLVNSGLSILDSFEITKGTVTSKVLKKEIHECQIMVREGSPIAAGFEKSRFVPKLVKNLISVGEESGALGRVFNRVASFYKVQTDSRLENLSKAIEPILLVFIFGMVAVLALAVFLPMWKMSQVIKK